MKKNPFLLRPKVRAYERALIREALAQHPQPTMAAALLGITVSTLNRKLARK